ncbi:hypothetical protein AB0L62_09885 [Nocardia asteroides]|uniref:hypothetical protein n=1 Tax=Nocardia asteroides TaxID=1824 RepID=UPI00342790C0
MTATSTALYCGTHWEEQGRWFYALLRADGSTELLPGIGTRLAFRVTSGDRFCLGYHGFGAGRRGRQACPRRAVAESGKQCAQCRITEGWSVVHGHRGPLSTLPEQIQGYVAQPHHLYIAYFGDGMAKVGTASAIRRHRRLFEQGALVARFITDSPDGLHVRELERVVSERAGLRQAVAGVTKTRILTKPLPPWPTLESASPRRPSTRRAPCPPTSCAPTPPGRAAVSSTPRSRSAAASPTPSNSPRTPANTC